MYIAKNGDMEVGKGAGKRPEMPTSRGDNFRCNGKKSLLRNYIGC
jgi:hypothetical protein